MNHLRKHIVYNWEPSYEMFTVVIATSDIKILSMTNYLVTINLQYDKCAKQMKRKHIE